MTILVDRRILDRVICLSQSSMVSVNLHILMGFLVLQNEVTQIRVTAANWRETNEKPNDNTRRKKSDIEGGN